MNWFYSDGNKAVGPLAEATMMELRTCGMLSADTQVCKEGTEEWVPYHQAFAEVSNNTRRAPVESVGAVQKFADSMASVMGAQKVSGFKPKKVFGDIFKKHSMDDMQDFYSCGSPLTTPRLDEIEATWPSPWIFARVLLLSILLYFGFNWAVITFENPKLLPGLIFAGNFAVPFSFLVLFAELNIRRNVSWFFIMRFLLGGGLVSLIFALVLFQVSGVQTPFWAGPIEETAKLLAVVVFARKRFNDGRILTGLLLGAAVGSGFAIFESAGYTFENLGGLIALSAQGITDGGFDPDSVMRQRAIFSPFCHIIWTAITAGALWHVMNQNKFSISLLMDKAFLRIALIPVILHMVWNGPILPNAGLGFLFKATLCGIAGWTAILILVNQGIAQIRAEKDGVVSVAPSNSKGFSIVGLTALGVVVVFLLHGKVQHRSSVGDTRTSNDAVKQVEAQYKVSLTPSLAAAYIHAYQVGPGFDADARSKHLSENMATWARVEFGKQICNQYGLGYSDSTPEFLFVYEGLVAGASGGRNALANIDSNEL